MDKIINAGIRITRKCTMRCEYCNIPTTIKDDLGLDEWKKALSIIRNLGAKDVVILGGEPTAYREITELVYYITHDLQMNCSLTTNAFRNFDKVVELLNAGLTKLGVSIDTLDLNNSISKAKCIYGLELIEKLKKEYTGNYTLVNYTVLNRKNCQEIGELIKYMSSNDVHTYILPFHWGNEGKYEHRKDNENNAFITEKDLYDYNKTMDFLIELKTNGYLIDNSIEFFQESKKHIKSLSWKCNGLSELRVDSNGQMVCCCDKIGKVNNNFSIFDLENPEKLLEFFAMREEDSSSCTGCLWPSSFEAELKKVRSSNI